MNADVSHVCGLIHTKGMYQALSDFQDPPLRVALWRTRRRDEIRLCQGYDGHVARQGSAFAKATARQRGGIMNHGDAENTEMADGAGDHEGFTVSYG